jgi:FAD/FMN-containing dehydrogenase/Fe-S oxidoreductase
MTQATPDSGRRAFLAGGAAKATQRSELVRRLRKEMQGQVFGDRAGRGRYATDASIYQIVPVAVAVPQSDLDVRIAIDIARDLGVPVLPRGAGTSQCGQTVGEALVIDHTRHLRQVTHVDPEGMLAEVQPGVVLDHLNAVLRPHGLWFPVDVSTSAQCTIGGMAGNNSCGSRSLRYGNMVHNVEGIHALLADGTRAYFGRFGDGGDMALTSARLNALVPTLFSIAERVRSEIGERWPRVLRRVGGYNLDIFHPQGERPYLDHAPAGLVNLAHLLVGSEGTLACFESIRLKLAPIPRARVLGVVNFPSFSLAMSRTRDIVGLGPSAVELVDRTMIDLALANPVFAPVIGSALAEQTDSRTEAILLVEFSGDDIETARTQLDHLEVLMADLGLPGCVVRLEQAATQSALWEVRKAGLNIMMSLRGDGKPVSFIEDCAVPLEHLAEYTTLLTEVFARHGTRGTWYAHASVGTLHVRPILDMRRDGAAKMRAIAEEASALVRRFKGAYSGEHGDGLVRTEWVTWQFGPQITRAFEEVKDAFDPRGLMNPGKIVRGGPMDDTRLFRTPPGLRPVALETGFDWSAWNVRNDPAAAGDAGTFGIAVSSPGTGDDPSGGWVKAIEMCNNNGHCRKFDAGTMCPSYRVTRDEQHSVRGRANTLRLALNGQLASDVWSSPDIRDALDLCVGCKGCKRECPTGVDMARMKIEALYQYGSRKGFSRKDRLLAALPKMAARVAAQPWMAPVLNLRNYSAMLRALTERFLGIAAERRLPQWRRDPFSRRLPELADLTNCDIVLWADTFNDAFEPDNLRDALAVMRAQGLRVAVSGAAGGERLCCGRTALSVGMIDDARAQARQTLGALAPVLARRDVPIVGLEPSCILGMRDEWLALGLGEPAVELASRVRLFEEWWLDHIARNGQPANATQQGEVLVHGHCHQKAMGAISPTVRALESFGVTVRLIPSSCCGMAGSFGYEARHLATSLAMAHADLVPAVRDAAADAWIVADGFSCRHQISDTTRRDSMHVSRAIARLTGVG